MLKSFLSLLRSNASNDAETSRRKDPRRRADRCVAVICGQAFPVEDWSMGGLQIAADDRLFSVGQDMELTVKFKLRNTILEVSHRGRIVRKANQKVAFSFEPLPLAVSRAFQQVIDDQVAREFANSQAV